MNSKQQTADSKRQTWLAHASIANACAMARCDLARRAAFLSFAFCVLPFAFLSLSLSAQAQSGRKPPPKPGQQGAEQKPGDAPVVRIETREIALPLLAYDADGKFVDDLMAKDVLVLEEGEARQVTNVKREPANIVLILDTSNEIGTFKNGPTQRLGKTDVPIWEKGASYQVITRPTAWQFAEFFISQLSPNDSLTVIQYADRVQVVQDWTNDRTQALNALRAKYRVGIKASFLDALKLAADKLQTRPNGRRVVVLVSDGLDSGSKTGRTQALSALAQARAAVFAVGWGDVLKQEVEIAANWIGAHEPASSSNNKRIQELRRHLPKLEAAIAELQNLVDNSGGELWLPLTHDELITRWPKVVSTIGAQYSLSFVTERKPSLEDLRSIQVLPARAGLSVRSRRNYYAGDETKTETPGRK